MSDKPIEEYYRLLRKHQKSLTVAGEAMIAFGVWTFIKIIMTLFLGNDDTLNQVMNLNSELSPEIKIIVFIVSFVLVVSVAFFIHLIIGLGAYREGRGKKKGWFYLFLDILMGISSVISIGLLIQQGSLLTSIPSFVFEISLIMVSFDIFHSAIRCRSITRKLKKLQGGAYEQ